MKQLGGRKLFSASVVACVFAVGFVFTFQARANAADSLSARNTLARLQGVRVIVEDLQPSFVKKTRRPDFAEHLRISVEATLTSAGIKVLRQKEWENTPGRPLLYINVNTDEREKYWFAYDARLELMQLASLETDPAVKALASTWSTNMTGMVDVGNCELVQGALLRLTRLFIEAYQSAKGKTTR